MLAPAGNAAVMRNRVFDDLRIGDSASLTRVASDRDIALFAAVSGDVNPSHLDSRFAATQRFGHIVVHGMWTAALVSAVLGTELPGPGTIYLGQELSFTLPVEPGDLVTATVTVTEKLDNGRVRLATECSNQRGQVVLRGVATVLAPLQPVEWPRVPGPDVMVQRHDRYEEAMREARGLGALPTAIVHPCSKDALVAAIEARDQGLLDPVLIGPEPRIRLAAEQAGVSLEGVAIDPVEHSHAAACRAVELAVHGRVGALMKGSLHTDELLAAVVAPGSGLHTGRRISHAFVMDVPSYGKPFVITDAAVNIAPTLAQKRDICQNAVNLLHVMGVACPRVAVLAAVETVNAAMPATLDAAALTVMSTRGQIEGAIVDGPLAFDNAISLDAARTKALVSPVAGQADVLLVPDLESGNMLAKQLMYLANADAAGLVVGARVPIILTSRADSVRVRLASAALGRLVAARRESVSLPA
ncbi:bifunctional enoyl-CoA hydratase/phosphate acetyltransferase [Ramlibacter monticola]|uniref:Bifunctional enoyl-CoA hydratase/phosphate acetyltransferase n=1 Tax=Ramlibacter monticola TaxID=1926872 RepID=A0A936YXB3_9BURK|nr:bifunctional enoyl-CoA hydratase/phosphate acetyltransferase [Ramlibacter monticola]MBL0391205.1 bifunctional enoyl-CoA hydratase/phosphate acetyltransferase [Ramlibacter monticola]